MQWLDAFDAARQRGAHAFLFTGSVGDAFPPQPQPEGVPVDALAAWAEVVERWVREGEKQNPAPLVWSFDAVNGFAFRDRDDENVFRNLGGLTPLARVSDSAIDNAQAQVAAALPLPNEALGALRLMRTVLQGAASDQKPTRCVVILPHADVLCPAGGAMGGTSPSALAALALLQIASSDAFRRAGHLVLLAAPTAASVDEQLRRTDGPITTIVVGKPSDAERAAFVDRCCSSALAEHQQRCADAHAERAALVRAEQERIAAQMAPLRDQRAAHDARRADVLAQDDAYQRAFRARKSAQATYDRARIAHEEETAAQREVLLREQAQLDAQLDERIVTTDVPRDPALACAPLDADVWKRMEARDALRFLFQDDHCEDLIVVKCHRDGQRTFSVPAPAQSDALVLDWRGGVLMVVRDTSQPMPLPSGCIGMVWAPAARRALEVRRAEVADEIAYSTEPWDANRRATKRDLDAFQKMHKPLDEAEHAVTAAEVLALESWAQQLRALDEQLAAQFPVTAAITALDEHIVVLESARNAVQRVGKLPLPRMGRDAFIRATQGLGYRDIATLLRDLLVDAGTVAQRRIALLQRAYGHLLEVVEPQYGFDGLAGLVHVKLVLTQARDAMLRGDRKAVPQGILLMGPPGTGKTAVAEAYARECDMLLVKMRNIRNMFVGNSEQRVEEVCQALRDLAPCVCFRDETDQEDSGRDAYQGDSGISNRIRQALMAFEADERIRGRVLFVKATNRPDLMDPAMKRDGRADERIVMVTGAPEYAALFPTFVQREHFPCTVTDFAPFVPLVQERGFSGAGVLNICRRAYQFGNGTITEQSLRDAIADTVASADRVADARMTLAAFAAANSHRSLPDDAQRIVADALALVRGAAPVTPADVARALTNEAENAVIVDLTKGQKN